MNQNTKKIVVAIKKQANPQKAKHSQRFFKTDPGEYGEGDLFLGVSTPIKRDIAKRFKKDICLNDLVDLISDPYHDIRQVGLFLLVELFKKAKTQKEKKHLVDFYLNNSAYINNWDLVDCSADKIVGQYLYEEHLKLDEEKTPNLLIKLAKSNILWERRIAILSTFPFIRAKQFLPTIELAKKLINDQEDLIHKAVGWLLREVGKREEKVLIDFLDQYSLKMPRTMLRYSIEKLPEKKRQFYLKKS
jgi:3-methyladenine DNA glycosylase AlkD